MTIAPQVRAFLDAEAALGLPRLSQLSPDAGRAQAVRHAELIGPGPDVAALDELLIPVADATIRARRYVPISTNPYGEWSTLVWFHAYRSSRRRSANADQVRVTGPVESTSMPSRGRSSARH